MTLSFLKQPKQRLILLSVVLVIGIALVGLGIYLTRKSQDNRQKASTVTTVTKQQTVVLSRFKDSCDWGKDGNLDKKEDYMRARTESSKTFSYTTGCTVQSATITAPSSTKFDDTLWLLLDNKIATGWKNVTSTGKLSLGGTWNWDAIKNINLKTHTSDDANSVPICFGGGTCTIPSTERSGAINVTLPTTALFQLLGSGASHTFGMVITGDNNDSDCKISADVTLTLNLSCQTVVPECSDGLDNDGDGKIDCTAGNSDPGCFPDGHGGGGVCNPQDDSEQDDIPQWIGSAACTNTFSFTQPNASPVPSPAASPIVSPVPGTASGFVIETYNDQNGDASRETGEPGLDWSFQWDLNGDGNYRDYTTAAQNNGRGGNVGSLKSGDVVRIRLIGKSGWSTTNSSERTITVTDNNIQLAQFGVWQPVGSPIPGSPKPAAVIVASPTPTELPVTGSETQSITLLGFGAVLVLFGGYGFYSRLKR